MSETLHIVDVAVRRGTPGDYKVEPNEAPSQAAVRELYEETGLAVSEKSLDYVGVFEFRWHGRNIKCYSFALPDNTFGKNAPQAMEPGTSVMWVDRGELLDPVGRCLSPAFYGWLFGKKDW